MNIRVLLLIAAILGYGAWQFVTEREISHPPGILAADDPRQENLRTAPPLFNKAGYTITALAKFDADARVIHKERYRFDHEADLSPIDLALGWGRMSDTAVLRGLTFSQDHRFYFYRWSGAPPIPPAEIISHSANMHFIPANERVAKKLSQVRAGNLVHFSGYLVKAEDGRGWSWVSSLTRDDTGAGACELVWLEEMELR